MIKKVLLVTHNLLTEELLARPLRRAGYEVVFASNARDAVEHCSVGRLHLLLLDLDWPSNGGGVGPETVKEMLKLRPYEPIIVISGQEDLTEAVEALGVVTVFGKPIDVPALLQTADTLTDQTARTRSGRSGKRAPDLRRQPPSSDAFRRTLSERADAPIQIAGQPRDWGLNE